MGDKVLVGVVGRGDGDGDDGGADGGGALGEVIEPGGAVRVAVVVALHGADYAAAAADDATALAAVAAVVVAAVGAVSDDGGHEGGEDEKGEEALERVKRSIEVGLGLFSGKITE